MHRTTAWQSDEVLAFTEHDGPGRAPTGTNRALWLVLAGVLGVVFAGMIMTDTLCPEHRMLVRTLGTLALFGTGIAVVGLVRGWAGAPFLTLGTAAIGVAIGLIDATHDTTRGRVIALAFAVALLGAAVLCVRQFMLARWEQRTLAGRALDTDVEAISYEVATDSAKEPSTAHAR